MGRQGVIDAEMQMQAAAEAQRQAQGDEAAQEAVAEAERKAYEAAAEAQRKAAAEAQRKAQEDEAAREAVAEAQRKAQEDEAAAAAAEVAAAEKEVKVRKLAAAYLQEGILPLVTTPKCRFKREWAKYFDKDACAGKSIGESIGDSGIMRKMVDKVCSELPDILQLDEEAQRRWLPFLGNTTVATAFLNCCVDEKPMDGLINIITELTSLMGVERTDEQLVLAWKHTLYKLMDLKVKGKARDLKQHMAQCKQQMADMAELMVDMGREEDPSWSAQLIQLLRNVDKNSNLYFMHALWQDVNGDPPSFDKKSSPDLFPYWVLSRYAQWRQQRDEREDEQREREEKARESGRERAMGEALLLLWKTNQSACTDFLRVQPEFIQEEFTAMLNAEIERQNAEIARQNAQNAQNAQANPQCTWDGDPMTDLTGSDDEGTD